jgi:hypothetical protein
MAQAQTNQVQSQKILRATYPYYVRSGERIGVVLESKDGKRFAAFLDPKRIKKVIEAAVPIVWDDGWRGILVIVPRKDEPEVHYTRVPGNEVEQAVERRRKEYGDAKILVDHVIRYFIVYETSHSYYDPAAVEKIEGVVIKEGGLKMLRDVSSRVRECDRGRWRVYLEELGKWDHYCFSLATVFNVIQTNIHPYYGVMD